MPRPLLGRPGELTKGRGTLPDTLLESELFGYKAGAFTDAKKDKLGRCMEPPGENETMNMKNLEAVFIMNMLRRHQWNRIKTAKALGIHKSTLFRKIKSLHIQIPAWPKE